MSIIKAGKFKPKQEPSGKPQCSKGHGVMFFEVRFNEWKCSSCAETVNPEAETGNAKQPLILNGDSGELELIVYFDPDTKTIKHLLRVPNTGAIIDVSVYVKSSKALPELSGGGRLLIMDFPNIVEL